MADELRLFRAMQPIARKFYEAQRKAGAALDARALTEQTVREFERAVMLEPHAGSLRERLETWVRHLIANGGTPPAQT